MSLLSKAQIKAIRSLQHKKFRDESGLFVAEGDKCIQELGKGFELVEHLTKEQLSGVELAQLSSLRTPQGSIAVFRKREPSAIEWDKEELVMALDGVQDPGNLGTIIRTCDWFGVHRLVCSKDTADCYNPKVVQATMGSLARVEVMYTDLEPFLRSCREQELPIYGTLLEGDNVYECSLAERAVIIMGNEGRGLREGTRALLTQGVRIPSYPEGASTAESLNVAIASALMLQVFRRGK